MLNKIGSQWYETTDKLQVGGIHGTSSFEFDGWLRDFFVFVPNDKFYNYRNMTKKI